MSKTGEQARLADEGGTAKRGRPPRDPLLSGYGDTKLLSVKIPATQFTEILDYIERRFENEGLHLGVSDVVRHGLVRLGINGVQKYVPSPTGDIPEKSKLRISFDKEQ